MKFDSPLFDRIRVKPARGPPRQPDVPCCDWKGCDNAATHRAPKGRTRENEYWRFCLEHVREYNHSYNYFSGMSDDAVAEVPEGRHHRTPPDLEDGNRQPSRRPSLAPTQRAIRSTCSANSARGQGREAEPPRAIRNAERKALHELGLEVGADKAEIKARFKMLVKRHHPDANGGDRATEDKLREIIQAYNYLKTTGALK